MTNEPMTPEHLAEIKARCDATGSISGAMALRSHAHVDIPALVAEVERLTRHITAIEDYERCDVCNCELQFSGHSPDMEELYDCPLCRKNAEVERLQARTAQLEQDAADNERLNCKAMQVMCESRDKTLAELATTAETIDRDWARLTDDRVRALLKTIVAAATTPGTAPEEGQGS
jgi:DNA repair exonuclease SbcCD ATPase subunit